MAQANQKPVKSNEQLLAEWQEASRQLALWKEIENNARNATVAAFFPDDATDPDAKGTRNYVLAEGAKLKCVFKQNVTIAKGEPLETALTKIEAMGERGKLIAERVIRWKPELDAKEYDAMPDDMRVILDTVITTKPGTPALEVVVKESAK